MSVQSALARIRMTSARARDLLGNTPVLLMRDGVLPDGAHRQSRVARQDVLAKIRTANVLDISPVRAVVLENTGNIAVLHGSDLNEDVLGSVRGENRLP